MNHFTNFRPKGVVHYRPCHFLRHSRYKGLRLGGRGSQHLHSRRSPTCLKQKGMVSTLTPTMLFTTFMMRPELDAVILKRLKTGSPLVRNIQHAVRSSWKANGWIIYSLVSATDRIPSVLRITPPTCDVAVCENTNTSVAGLTRSKLLSPSIL